MSDDDRHANVPAVDLESRYEQGISDKDRRMSLSMELHLQGCFQEAREVLQPCLSIPDPDILASVAVLDALLGDMESARNGFLAAIEYREDPELLRGLAHICSQSLERGDEAIELLYRSWLASGDLNDLLAAATIAEGLDLEMALTLYVEALTIESYNRLALFRGGQVMEAMGDLDGAESLYVRMLESDKDDITGLNAMCSLCGVRSDLASARGFNDAVLLLEPDDLYANTVRQWLDGQGDEDPEQ